MKHFLTVAVVVALTIGGWSARQAAAWFSTAATQLDRRPAQDDPLASEAAFRHRTCQPRHWRGMLLRD